ncbi:MAG: DPP IV N-terminal domain-containing protein [Bacteroidia bacterium]
MKQTIITFIAILFLVPGFAQNKMLEVRDCVNPRTAYPNSKRQLSWRGDGNNYCYVDYSTNTLMEGSNGGSESSLLSMDKINEGFDGENKLKRFPYITWEDANHFTFTHAEAFYRYHIESGELTKLAPVYEGAEFLETSSSGNVAFNKNNNLVIIKSGTEVPYYVAEDGSRELTYGKYAHRREFGITKGLFWSPNGQNLAFYRVDRSMVTDYPLVDYSVTPAKAQPTKYPMAGMASHQATLGIYNTKTDKMVYLETGKPVEKYLTNITWSPSGDQIYVAIVNRDQNHMELASFDANTGKKITILFEEKQDKYVEPEHGPIFCFKNNPDQFIWFSERSGYDHLYLYDTKGSMKKQLTKGDWEVTEVLGMAPDGETLYFMATKESPLERHAYSVNVNSGKIKKITQEKGTHRCSLSADGDYLIDSYSSREVPNVQQVIRTKNGKQSAAIHTAENPLKDYKLGEMSFVEIDGADGTKLYGRLIKPVDFDPNKKYPSVTYVYGGPHVQLVTESWNGGAQLFLQYLASQGYVVFTLDSRGSGHRGLAFEQATFRNLGTEEMKDQLKGAEYLKSLSYVDADRMGMSGWSFGGYMTSTMMLRQPGTYKVGVAGGPVVDWKFYEVMYTERYMDTPKANPEGYKETSLLSHVENLEGRLLIIHGLLDDTVVPQHTRALLRKGVEKGKHFDYYAYPAHPHNVRGWDRVHLLEKMARYFKDFL